MKIRILISFIISLIYVLLGTLVAITSFPKYAIAGFDYNHSLWTPILIITLPTNLLLFGLLMVSDSLISIIIIQTITFCLIWLLIYKIIKKSK